MDNLWIALFFVLIIVLIGLVMIQIQRSNISEKNITIVERQPYWKFWYWYPNWWFNYGSSGSSSHVVHRGVPNHHPQSQPSRPIGGHRSSGGSGRRHR